MSYNDMPSLYRFDEVRSKHRREGLPVVAMTVNYRYPDVPRHAHDFIEIVTVNRGRGRHLLDGGEERLTAGDVFIIPRGVRHGYANDGGLAITNLLFQMEAVDRAYPSLREMPGFPGFFLAEEGKRSGRLLSLNAEELAGLEELEKRIFREQAGSASGRETILLALLAEVLVYLARLLENRPAAEAAHPLFKVRDYLQKHAAEKTPVAQLAALAHMSERNFQRVFFRVFGETPAGFRLRLRLEKARELLKATDWEVGRIAAETGFSGNAYLSRCFREWYGVSPGEFRREVRSRDST